MKRIIRFENATNDAFFPIFMVRDPPRLGNFSTAVLATVRRKISQSWRKKRLNFSGKSLFFFLWKDFLWMSN